MLKAFLNRWPLLSDVAAEDGGLLTLRHYLLVNENQTPNTYTFSTLTSVDGYT